MKKLLCVSASVLAMSVFCASAEDAAKPADAAAPAVEKVKKEHKADMPKPVAREMTVTGVISKTEAPNKKGEATVTYVLTGDDGATIRLPNRPSKTGTAPVKFEEYVGVKVKIAGLGFEKDVGGKKKVALVKINTIEKAADQPAAK